MANEHPLKPVVQTWLRVIQAGVDAKAKRFGADAAECMRFLTGPYDFFWNQMKTDRHFRRDGADSNVESWGAEICVQTNKVAEFVQLFGPSLYAKNPIRRVTPRPLPDLPPELYAMMGPEAQMLFQMGMVEEQKTRYLDEGRAALLETYESVTPQMLDLRGNSRSVVEEALIKGMGIWWPGPYKVPGANFTMIGSFYGTVDDLIIDPDCRNRSEAKWVARRCVKPVWEVEQMFGLPPGSLAGRGQFESYAQQAGADVLHAQGQYLGRVQGESNDLMVYWDVWSKMGCGGRLRELDPTLRPLLEGFGDYCWLVVAEGVPYPLNVPPDIIAAPDGAPVAKNRMQWQTPFWADHNGWPFYEVAFHEVPNDPWPLAHLAPAMGELKFLNWAFGHIAAKVRTTTRDFIAVLKSAGEEIKAKVLSGSDLSLIEISEAQGKSIDQIVKFLQHPEFNGDIWKVMEAVMGEFEKRTGLTELMYGESAKQMRSGTEAQLKGDQLSVRPDDMAECVEAAMSKGARMEALACRWHLKPEDVAPVIGKVGAVWWGQLVYATTDIQKDILFNLTYRVEAGSAKKPNKARDTDQANALMNNLFQPFLNWGASTGDMNPVNALVRKWGKAQDIPNINDFLFLPPPMPVQPAGATPPEKKPAGPT